MSKSTKSDIIPRSVNDYSSSESESESESSSESEESPSMKKKVGKRDKQNKSRADIKSDNDDSVMSIPQKANPVVNSVPNDAYNVRYAPYQQPPPGKVVLPGKTGLPSNNDTRNITAGLEQVKYNMYGQNVRPVPQIVQFQKPAVKRITKAEQRKKMLKVIIITVLCTFFATLLLVWIFKKCTHKEEDVFAKMQEEEAKKKIDEEHAKMLEQNKANESLAEKVIEENVEDKVINHKNGIRGGLLRDAKGRFVKRKA